MGKHVQTTLSILNLEMEGVQLKSNFQSLKNWNIKEKTQKQTKKTICFG